MLMPLLPWPCSTTWYRCRARACSGPAAAERQKLNREALMDQRRGERGDERTTLEFNRDEYFRNRSIHPERTHQGMRVGNASKFNNQMLGLQEKYQDDAERGERDHQRRLTGNRGRWSAAPT